MDEKNNSEIPPDLVDEKGNEVKAEVKLLGEKDEKHEIDHKPRGPVDRFYIVYIIFIIHGIGVLMPWNMFITANDYFVNYKLAEIKPNGTSVEEGEKSLYQLYFLGFLGFVAQIPTVILNGVNAFSHGLGGSTSRRITWSIIVVVVMFVLTIILAMVDSSEWPAAFFWLTMASVVILNMANGMYQNSIFGTAACLPMKYPNAVIVGSNISGTLTSIIMILSKVSAPDVRTSAIYYFLTAIFILLAAFDTFYILQYIPFYRHYSSKSSSSSSTQQQGSTVSSRPPYWEIFKKSWVHDVSCFLVFFVTLSVFPALQANIRPSDPNFFISDEYYSPVTCFLFFNLFALLGSIFSDFVKKPGPRWVWIPVLLRLLFIPFFVFCNVNPTSRRLPVIINNDYVYIIGAILMAFTSGYFSSLTMMYAPSGLTEPKHQEVAGMVAAFFLVLGIFSGVTFSIPLTTFIENVGGGGVGEGGGGAGFSGFSEGVFNFTTIANH